MDKSFSLLVIREMPVCLPGIRADHFRISATQSCKVLVLITFVSFSLAGFQGLDLWYETNWDISLLKII